MRRAIPLAAGLVLAAAAVIAAQAPPPAAPAAELRAQTRAKLEQIAGTLDGVAGYCIVDLTSGDRFERAAAQAFPTASTIKLAILYELMARAGEGGLSLDETIALDRARAVPGGILYELGTPVLSLRDYANVMVIESDNTATNVLIARLGMEAVTARMAKLGLSQTKLRRYMIDLEAAKQWYTDCLGVEAYFSRPGPDGALGYIEFRIGDKQKSIDDTKSRVEDIQKEIDKL